MLATHNGPHAGQRNLFAEIAIVITLGVVIFVAITITKLTLLMIAFALLVFLAAAFFYPDLTTLGVFFGLWANLAPAAVRYHHVPKIAAIAFFVILFVPLLHYVVVAGERLRTDAVLRVMCLYLVVQLGAALFSRHIENSTTSLLTYIFEGMLLYVLVLNTVRTAALLRRSLWAIVLAGALLGGLSLIQNVTKTYQQNYAGLALTKTTDSSGEIIDPTMEDTELYGSSPRPRSMGSIGDPNFFAQIMIVLLPISLIPLWTRTHWVEKLLAIACFASIFCGVVLSYSRGASLAFGALVIAMVCLRQIRLRTAVILFSAVALFVVATNPAYLGRIETVTGISSKSLRTSEGAIQGRATIMLAGFHMFLDHPFLGVGPGQAPDHMAEYSNRYGFERLAPETGSHSLYLEILAETGVVGFAVFLLLLFVALRPLLQLRIYWARERPEYSQTLTSLILAVLMFLVTGIFLHLAFARYFWLLLGLCGAARAAYMPPLASMATRSPRRRNHQTQAAVIQYGV
jgi:putative inorganic carbon (hco3(-)) transporter